MMHIPSMMRRNTRFAAKNFALSTVLSCLALGITSNALWKARSEDRVPGLTGMSRPDDVVMARQLLMAGVDDDMQDIDQATVGQEFPFAELRSRAYRISTLLTAFPHL